jgi:uncharacterized membrane protein YhaH (DUF805 family)
LSKEDIVTAVSQSRVGPLGYWVGCFHKYTTFEGRARRAEYWWYTLFNAIAYFVVAMAGLLIGYATDTPAVAGVLIALYVLAVLLPSLAVTCRRLHDAGLSGWWQLLAIIPGGSIAVLVMTILPGNPGSNRYGPDPRLLG